MIVMKTFLFVLFLFIGGAVNAQPATFQGSVLSIPQGAVIDNNHPAYYTDIQLDYKGNGSFVFVGAQAANNVAIDSVQVAILESFPLQINVTVTGNKSVPCVELLPPAISRQDNLFIVVLAETQLGPAETCIAKTEPFETTFALDVTGLPAGTYTVRVNGQVEDTFSLETDNTPDS